MPRTVLVVDDERDTNDILASLVQARGFEPIQVFTGAEALKAVAKQKPDLILLDLMLEDISGFELCDRLKRARETNLIPIVMVTAMHDAHHRAAGVRVGANGYLTKPFTPAQLYETMDAALAWNEEHNKRGTTGRDQFRRAKRVDLPLRGQRHAGRPVRTHATDRPAHQGPETGHHGDGRKRDRVGPPQERRSRASNHLSHRPYLRSR